MDALARALVAAPGGRCVFITAGVAGASLPKEPGDSAACAPTAPLPTPLQTNEPRPEELRVRALGGPGALVVADTFAPGWSATLDGEPTEIVRADGLFRAVLVGSPGAHEVVFRYRAPGLAAGAWISLGALAASLALLFASRLRRLRPARVG